MFDIYSNNIIKKKGSNTTWPLGSKFSVSEYVENIVKFMPVNNDADILQNSSS